MSVLQSMTNVDGKITKTEDAAVPVLDRGFLYGDSVYEVFRTVEGVPLFYDEHWRRLENSARLIHMQLGYSKEQTTEQIRKTIRATGAPQSRQDVYVRYTLTRGEGPVDLYPGRDLKTRYVIIVKAVPVWNPEFYSRGMSVAIPRTRRNAVNTLDPNIKGGNYLNNVLGVIEARERGAVDCVMLNEQDFVTEASNSNVFFVIEGELVTPAPAAGNLLGLTKEALHAACKQNGLESIERDIAVHELPAATECFVTSATRDVMPVISLRLEDDTVVSFPEGGGRITRQAAGCLHEYIGAYVREHPGLSVF